MSQILTEINENTCKWSRKVNCDRNNVVDDNNVGYHCDGDDDDDDDNCMSNVHIGHTAETKHLFVNNPQCNGCNEVIYDKYLIAINDGYWHKSCTMCCICKEQLSDSCFMMEECQLFCRNHYYKSKYSTKCAGCGNPMQTHEVAMKALHRIYHVTCFACAVCKQLLQRGDQFLVYNPSQMGGGKVTASSATSSSASSLLVCRKDFELGNHLKLQKQQTTNQNKHSTTGPGIIDQSANHESRNSNGSHYNYSPRNEDCHDLCMHHHDNGMDNDSSVDNNELNPEGHHRGQRSGVHHHHQSCNHHHHHHNNNHSNNLTNLSNHNKRPRTTLTFEQKRRLMVFFKSCQNPSYKQRESLSEEMKLPPKVIQVWFQNQRAKVRQIKKLSSQMSGGSQPGSLAEDRYEPSLAPNSSASNLPPPAASQAHHQSHHHSDYILRDAETDCDIKRECATGPATDSSDQLSPALHLHNTSLHHSSYDLDYKYQPPPPPPSLHPHLQHSHHHDDANSHAHNHHSHQHHQQSSHHQHKPSRLSAINHLDRYNNNNNNNNNNTDDLDDSSLPGSRSPLAYTSNQWLQQINQ